MSDMHSCDVGDGIVQSRRHLANDETGFTHTWPPIRLGHLAILLLQRAPEAIDAEQREEY